MSRHVFTLLKPFFEGALSFDSELDGYGIKKSPDSIWNI
jgi:hypothetical protein